MSLRIVVVSPARPLYEGEAKFLSIETSLGRIGVAPRHAELVASLGTGPMRIDRPDGSADRFAVSGGFLKVGKDHVTILVDEAVRSGEVDESAVRRELEETLAGLRRPASDEQFESLLQRRSWCQARLNAVK